MIDVLYIVFFALVIFGVGIGLYDIVRTEYANRKRGRR